MNPAVTLENAPVVDTDMDERLALLRVLNDFVARPDMNPPRIAYLLGLSAADVVDLQTDKHQRPKQPVRSDRTQALGQAGEALGTGRGSLARTGSAASLASAPP